jgi:ribulose-phosphate 3-epimerase
MNITPAILPENFEQIINKLFILEGLCKRVQIDLCDGVFGLEKTWLPYEEVSLPHGFDYEFDLMVNDWRKYLSRALALGATRVVMHVDSATSNEIDEMIEMAEVYGARLGLSVSNNYDIHDFAARVNQVAARYRKVFIQVMGIKHIGAQGQPFDESVIPRIVYLSEHCQHIEIQVDGSMNSETVVKVKNAGAICVVVGSYLFKTTDVKKTLEDLERSIK